MNGLRLEGHSVIFLAIDSLGLRWSGSSPQIINQPLDYLEQASRNRRFGQLKGDVAAMSDNLGTDLHQLLPQRRQRQMLLAFGRCSADFGNARSKGALGVTANCVQKVCYQA